MTRPAAPRGRRGVGPEDVKWCARCGARMDRKAMRVSPSTWRQRRHCSQACTGRVYVKPGDRYGRWIVLEFAEFTPDAKRTRWRVRCDCGTVRVVGAGPLTRGQTRSCGCWQKELSRARCYRDPTWTANWQKGVPRAERNVRESARES